MLALFPSMSVVVVGLVIALGAGVVRGFSGFGFSALCVAGLSVFVAPSVLVPAVLTLEVLASLSLLRESVGAIDRRWLAWFIGGSVVFTPIGILLLATVPQHPLTLLVGLALLLTAAGLRAGLAATLAPSAGVQATAGISAGLLNGLAASGGVAAAMLMTAAGVKPATLRATMIVYLLFAGIYAIATAAIVGGAGANQLLTMETVNWILLLGPAMFAGIWIGRRWFGGANPARYRNIVLNLLIMISALTVSRALWYLNAG